MLVPAQTSDFHLLQEDTSRDATGRGLAFRTAVVLGVRTDRLEGRVA
ncbi:hypothetical protein L195_g063136, partial [Trifolium pratense]